MILRSLIAAAVLAATSTFAPLAAQAQTVLKAADVHPAGYPNVVAIESLGNSPRVLTQRSRLPQAPGLERQRLVLSHDQASGLYLACHVPEVVCPAANFIPPCDQRLCRLLQFPAPLPGFLKSGACRQGIGVGVEDVTLGVCMEQRLRLVLPMEVYQHGAEAGKHAHSSGAAVDPCARSAFGRNFAPDDDAALLGVEPQFIELRQRGSGKLLEHALDNASRCTRTHLRRVGSLTQKEGERVNQH